MLFKKDGYPEEDELVLCTITKVHPHSVFCDLDEYNHKSGMIHISEVSPGRIRNIRDYAKEGKKVVCLILKIHKDRGHIDLSLRRVNEIQKRRKQDSIKQEQKAEKIVELLAQQLKKPFKEVYKEVSKPIFEGYEMLYLAFNEVVELELKLADIGLDKKLAEKLTAIVKDKIKPKQVLISGDFEVISYDEDGLKIVQEALTKADEVDEKVDIRYEGGGRYKISVFAKEYKEAEEIMKNATSQVIDFMESKGGTASFQRHEK